MKIILPNITFMKRILSVATIAVVMVACNPNPQPGQVNVAPTTPLTDTIGLAEYQAWKAQNELQNFNQQNNGSAVTQPYTRTTRTYSPQRSTTTRSTSTARRSSGTSSRGSGNTGTASTSTRKEGWSKAAKGAVIGGVTGGVAGAVINKRNRVVGGVVGAVIGGGGGYIIGRSQDKKDGRY